jgi:hypothetical protein
MLQYYNVTLVDKLLNETVSEIGFTALNETGTNGEHTVTT